METWIFVKGIATVSEPLTKMPACDFIWLDATPQDLNLVSRLIQELAGVTIHEQHLLDCINPTHPASFDNMQDYDILIFRGLLKYEINARIETAPIIFFMLDKILVTIHQQNSVIADMKQRIRDPKRAHPKQLNSLLCQILNGIIDQYLVLRDPLAEEYHYWQMKLLDEKSSFKSWHDLLNYKTSIQRLYMLSEQQLDAVNQWHQEIDEDINDYFSVKLNDIAEHIRRVLRFAYQLERQLESLMQLHYSLISTRTNEVMRVLTVISAIFLPLTLLTGVFGMNFEFMPLLRLHHGFAITMCGMFIIILLLLSFFRWRKWV